MPATISEPRRTYSADEVAAMVGLSKPTVLRLGDTGEIPGKLPLPSLKKALFVACVIDAWLEGRGAQKEPAPCPA
jgi:predicted DNA-binding transcriptional regulator AlpA